MVKGTNYVPIENVYTGDGERSGIRRGARYCGCSIQRGWTMQHKCKRCFKSTFAVEQWFLHVPTSAYMLIHALDCGSITKVNRVQVGLEKKWLSSHKGHIRTQAPYECLAIKVCMQNNQRILLALGNKPFFLLRIELVNMVGYTNGSIVCFLLQVLMPSYSNRLYVVIFYDHIYIVHCCKYVLVFIPTHLVGPYTVAYANLLYVTDKVKLLMWKFYILSFLVST